MENKKILFDKYELEKLLGKGNFGAVYHARNIRTQESVALKVLQKEELKKMGMADQIKHEITAMRLVRHPNIVKLYEVMASKSKIYLVMEFINGGDLLKKIEKGKLPEDLARRYFQQLISAVDFCHRRRVCHRDLKLENLLVADSGELKVADFGFAAVIGGGGVLQTVCGAPAYVAPEVLKRKGYDGARADVWSCGVILYAMISGELPFQHENLMKMYSKIIAGKFNFPPGFPYEPKLLIKKILVPNPDKRITIEEIIKFPWFRKGFKFDQSQSISIDQEKKLLEDESRNPRFSPSSPVFFNAFDLIQSMSPGFDLSNLFQKKRKPAAIFTSKSPAPDIIRRIEAAAESMKYKVEKVKDFKVKMRAPAGRTAVTAEVYKAAPEMAVVEFGRSAGDAPEYERFCEEIRPALKDLVWTWQGDSVSINGNGNSNGHFGFTGKP